jgi:Peptidase of plants and bacteria
MVMLRETVLRLNQVPLMRRSIEVILVVLLLGVSVETSSESEPKTREAPVRATILTTLTTSAGQVRQFAFDGDPNTHYASVEKPGVADHFTLLFDETVAVSSIEVISGRSDGNDPLSAGAVEISVDGRAFGDPSKFVDGNVRLELSGKLVRAVRIKPATDLNHALTIREIKISSDPPVATFQYPVEFIVDVSDAPDMKAWTEHVAEVCERSYPMINEELKSDGYKPPVLVTMSLKKSYRGVAAAGGSRITGSVAYFKNHPDDVGAMVHETTHVVQHYRSPSNPSWLVEGVSDYVRFFKFEPGKLGPINPNRAHYNGSYRITAAFLNYLTERYDKHIVLKLNRVMREGRYKDDVFQELTGKKVQDLDEEWRKTLRR